MGCCCSSWENNQVENVSMNNMSKLVVLNTKKTGSDCVVVKNGTRICGTGASLANAPLMQDKSYFELSVQATGTWGIGVATKDEDVQGVPLGNTAKSWVLRSDGSTYHNGELYSTVNEELSEGNIIGCSYDHIQLQFYLNGKSLDCSILSVRGTVFPVFYVDDGAILDIQFRDFVHKPPGYQEIMFEQNIL